jgi:putative phosphoribosyl transferase
MTKSAEAMAPRPVRLNLAGEALNADLTIPAGARGLVLFAHGSGSSRHSARNRSVADVLHHSGFATLLLDLLTETEEETDAVTAEYRFDIPRLADRLVAAIDWAEAHPDVASLRIGLFGASTGAAAALIAAARRTGAVRAVVSRGGRPDLAEGSLDAVVAPTLLIVGGNDEVVVEINQKVFERLKDPKSLEIVSGATHLFEEAGALERVAQLASVWFDRYLG